MIDINQIPDQIDIPVVTYVASNAKTTVPKDASRPVIKLEACMGAETQSQGITELSPSQEVVNYSRFLANADLSMSSVAVLRPPTHGKLIGPSKPTDQGPGFQYKAPIDGTKLDSFTVAVKIGDRNFEVRYVLHIAESHSDNDSTVCKGKPSYMKRISSVETYIDNHLEIVRIYDFDGIAIGDLTGTALANTNHAA
jgi:hypothetical protein